MSEQNRYEVRSPEAQTRSIQSPQEWIAQEQALIVKGAAVNRGRGE
jgi:hypothetical protein